MPRLSSKNNINKKLAFKYSFASWLFLKKLEKEGFIRYCTISGSASNKLLVEVFVDSRSIRNLNIVSSGKLRINLKNYNKNYITPNLGLLLTINSGYSNSLIKNFGAVSLVLR